MGVELRDVQVPDDNASSGSSTAPSSRGVSTPTDQERECRRDALPFVPLLLTYGLVGLCIPMLVPWLIILVFVTLLGLFGAVKKSPVLLFVYTVLKFFASVLLAFVLIQALLVVARLQLSDSDDATVSTSVCPKSYAPVCGVDDVTYGNSCEASVAGVAIAYDGPCARYVSDPIACPMSYAPVCGVNDVTYGNSCEASVAGVAIAYDGVCGADSSVTTTATVACPEYYAPVCGIDGVTYGNQCFADVADVDVAHDGPCESSDTGSVACVMSYAPVCGIDGETYGNACEASVAGIAVEHDGPCGHPTHYQRARAQLGSSDAPQSRRHKRALLMVERPAGYLVAKTNRGAYAIVGTFVDVQFYIVETLRGSSRPLASRRFSTSRRPLSVGGSGDFDDDEFAMSNNQESAILLFWAALLVVHLAVELRLMRYALDLRRAYLVENATREAQAIRRAVLAGNDNVDAAAVPLVRHATTSELATPPFVEYLASASSNNSPPVVYVAAPAPSQHV